MQVKMVREAGFTLVELLCTLSILGLVISLAVPNLSNLRTKATYFQLRYQIISQLEDAQLVAMASEMEVAVKFSNSGMTTWIGGKQKQEMKFPKNLQISSNYQESKVLFRENGHVRGGTIFIKRNNREWMKVVIQVASGTTKVLIHD